MGRKRPLKQLDLPGPAAALAPSLGLLTHLSHRSLHCAQRAHGNHVGMSAKYVLLPFTCQDQHCNMDSVRFVTKNTITVSLYTPDNADTIISTTGKPSTHPHLHLLKQIPRLSFS